MHKSGCIIAVCASGRGRYRENLKGASGGLRNTVLSDHTEEDTVNWQQKPLTADHVDAKRAFVPWIRGSDKKAAARDTAQQLPHSSS
ncbi:hypothetical protein T01_11229 [Trichinella spiralis]|uniref:Uncharacterized protein n=1 Tax=Trichinella spiralis TaxID=6334 RepID=A0A0V1AV11_TRISP|nr:hypothetical protein T01_11229 [Trichinella spiralis]